jgi:tellurite resistance protein TerC
MIWWLSLIAIVLIMLVLDLGVFHKKSHVIEMKEAIVWSIIWVLIALAFAFAIYYYKGINPAVLFLTGYLVEKSLSVDNLFVFIVIFSYFAIPGKYQHKILFWGIIGALVSRAVLIALGISLIQKFAWLTYVLGTFILITGIKTALDKGERLEPEKNPVIAFLRRVLPVANYFNEDKFFVKEGKKLLVTPLFIALIVVELTDVLFALDSIPAILAITLDPFLVYSSNLFAILGLRALYFALAGMMQMFEYLKYGISGILVLVGIKMLINDFFHLPEFAMLGLIILILGTSVVVSIFKLKNEKTDL